MKSKRYDIMVRSFIDGVFQGTRMEKKCIVFRKGKPEVRWFAGGTRPVIPVPYFGFIHDVHIRSIQSHNFNDVMINLDLK